MESVKRIEDPFTAPPPYLLSDKKEIKRNVGVYHISSTYNTSPLHPSPLHVPATTSLPLRVKSVRREIELCRSPALMTCDSCQILVTTQVSLKVGTYAWFMCLVFVLCGLMLGCCLIPFFVNHFKDAYHTCPHCQRVLHVHRRACFK
uniref:LITAF domain-containing protein n=1 Tax=Oryzias latipes TaxID=8090 RepID=A0A3P9M5N5_ORYLA